MLHSMSSLASATQTRESMKDGVFLFVLLHVKDRHVSINSRRLQEKELQGNEGQLVGLACLYIQSYTRSGCGNCIGTSKFLLSTSHQFGLISQT